MVKEQKTKYTVFHQAKEYINQRFEIYENTINCKFFIKSKKDKKDTFEQLKLENLYVEIQEAGIKLSMDNLINILKSSYTKKINPIKEYFEKLPKWKPGDTDHIKELTTYIKTVNDEWLYIQLKKWMVRAVKCVFIDQYFNKQALIFAQQGQNGGKSTFTRFFCPPELIEYKKELLSNVSTKDTKIEVARNLLMILDELAIMTKSDDIKNLKALMSIDFINERLPYARNNTVMPRICSYLGSTDNFEFLKDKTGNVRWIIIEFKNINAPIDFNYSKKININYLWSQAYYLANDITFKETMTPEEIRKNEVNNQKFLISDGITDIIQCEIQPGCETDDFMNASDILEYLKHIDSNYFDILKNVKPEKLGKILVQLGFFKDSSTINKNGASYTAYGYYVKKLSKQCF